MEQHLPARIDPSPTTVFDLGSFEGFNFKTQSAIKGMLSADEMIAWDHDRHGEAEFWPSGDHPGVALIFKDQTSVSASELVELDRLLEGLGGDSVVNLVRIYYVLRVCGAPLSGLSADAVENHNIHTFFGSNFTDIRHEAGYALFELYYPDEYRLWEKTRCDGLIFDKDRFLDSPCFFTDEIHIGEQLALLVAPW